MSTRSRWQHWKAKPVVRHLLMAAGVLLILLAPLVGLLPGPGGVFVFAGGLALVLNASIRAKRGYVLLKRRWPTLGRWVDWGLRRPRARRPGARARATR